MCATMSGDLARLTRLSQGQPWAATAWRLHGGRMPDRWHQNLRFARAPRRGGL